MTTHTSANDGLMIKDFSFADGNDDAYIQYSVNGGLMIKDFSFADAPALFL